MYFMRNDEVGTNTEIVYVLNKHQKTYKKPEKSHLEDQ